MLFMYCEGLKNVCVFENYNSFNIEGLKSVCVFAFEGLKNDDYSTPLH